ncbi:MAG: hypothetical protein CMB64_05270 [Euryarchaeota archaeon]|nr:hypothetical protein [Euryarchaeota archaeon]
MNTVFVVDALGIISSIFISIMFIPQITHIYNTKETLALNKYFLLINLNASLMGLIYAYYYSIIPMVIANSSASISSTMIIIMKYINERSG